MALQAKLLRHCFSKSCSILNFQNVAPILHSNLFEMNTASITNKKQRVVISSCFLWKLLLFIVKIVYNLLYNLISGLLHLLS